MTRGEFLQRSAALGVLIVFGIRPKDIGVTYGVGMYGVAVYGGKHHRRRRP